MSGAPNPPEQAADTPSAEVALLPCPVPWCAGEAILLPRGESILTLIKCSACSVSGPVCLTEAEAIAAWNTRLASAHPTGSGDVELALNEALRASTTEVAALAEQPRPLDTPEKLACRMGATFVPIRGGEIRCWEHEIRDADCAVCMSETVRSTDPPQPGGEGVFPNEIGRLHLGDRRSDGERLCAHDHAVPADHPLYWPQQISQYDDSDPYCLEHAIENYASEQGWPQPGGEPVSWIVGDGSGSRWRTWADGCPCWTFDISKAIQYARRKDAEMAHAEDEDAWRIVPFPPTTEPQPEPAPGWQEAALHQNDAMRQELMHIGNLVSDLARAMRIDQANPDGTWPDLAGRIQRLIAAAQPEPARGGELFARIAECAFDDRPRSRVGHPSHLDWEDGFRDGTRAAAAAIRDHLAKPAPEQEGRFRQALSNDAARRDASDDRSERGE